MVFCTVMVCALTAPTDKRTESNPTNSDSQEKSLLQHPSSILINSPSTEKRDKREDIPAASHSTDNKRTPVLQSDYQENKPPTFVYPVPVDQIIKNSRASPQIHA